MKQWIGIVLLVLAGCASEPKNDDLLKSSTASDTASKGDLARIRTELAGQYYASGKYAIALEEANKAVSASSSFAPAHNILGLIYMALRENAKAEAHFQRGISLSANDPDLNNNYGWFLCATGRERESLTYFQRAFTHPLYSTPDLAYANAGECAYKIGDFVRAKQWLERSTAYRTTHSKAMRLLAILNFNEKNHKQAQAYLLQFGRMSSLDAETLWLGVRIERALGDASAMASYAAQLSKNFPNSPEAGWLRQGKFE